MYFLSMGHKRALETQSRADGGAGLPDTIQDAMAAAAQSVWDELLDAADSVIAEVQATATKKVAQSEEGRAVDQDGDVLDVLVQHRRNQAASERFFQRVLKGQGQEPRRAVTDGLRSYVPAIRNVLPSSVHDRTKYANNRVENSHQHTRRRERQMQRFKSVRQAQRFLGLHARVGNLFRYGRHLMSAKHHRVFRERAFAVWSSVTCA